MLNESTYENRPGLECGTRGGMAPTGRLLIRRLETYGTFFDDDRAALTNVGAELRFVEAGHDIAVEDAQPHGFFIIVQGFACRYKLNRLGQRRIIAYLLPGDFCELDILLLPHMDHSIGSLSNCLVARLTPTTILNLQQHSGIARALRIATLAEAAITREWLVNVGGRPAIVRVAHLFCELFARLRRVELIENDSFDFPLTQADMADTMGMSTVHMNRSLHGLRDAKLIEMRHGRVSVGNLQRLEEFAQFKSNYLYLHKKTAA